MQSETIENYLKTIYHLSSGNTTIVNNKQLADKLNVIPATVTEAVKKLHELKLVIYEKSYGTRLTTSGSKMALSIVRRHRIWETYLANELGFGWDEVHEIAEELEHIKNDKLHFLQSDFIEAYKEIADVLLIIDVIEHVADYYGFLNKLKPKSKYFIFHIPIDMSINTVLKPHINLQQRDAVGHIHYFTKDSIFWMLQDCGYKIMDWHYTKPDYDFKPVKGLKLSIKKILRNITFSISEKWADRIWGNYSLMILAQQ